MSEFQKWIADFFWDRRTSPMYKSFLISWILWNWNFLYVVLFEDAQMIYTKTWNIKSEYIYKIYNFDWSSIIHTLLWPIISILLFFWVFDRAELWFRNKANETKRKQIDSDNKVKEKEVQRKNIDNKETNEEIVRLKQQLEIEQINAKNQLQKKQNEIENLKLLKKQENESENEILNQWNREYQEAKWIWFHFEDAMKKLQVLIWQTNQKEEIEIINKYGYIYITYDLYQKWYTDIDWFNPWKITEKGKFFLRKFISNSEIHNPYISRNTQIKETDLPF